jgi:cytochrome c1
MLLVSCSFLFATMSISSTYAQEETYVEAVVENAADEQTFQRKKTGISVVGFLAIYTFIVWRVKKKIWKDAHWRIGSSPK